MPVGIKTINEDAIYARPELLASDILQDDPAQTVGYIEVDTVGVGSPIVTNHLSNMILRVTHGTGELWTPCSEVAYTKRKLEVGTIACVNAGLPRKYRGQFSAVVVNEPTLIPAFVTTEMGRLDHKRRGDLRVVRACIGLGATWEEILHACNKHQAHVMSRIIDEAQNSEESLNDKELVQ